MTRYASLLACYRSGQIPEAAWQEHLLDEVFRRWLSARATSEARRRAA